MSRPAAGGAAADRRIAVFGGLCLIAGALAFVGVFGYLAAHFDYPKILDGSAAEVLPRLLKGGDTMRAVWAVYALLPLLLIPGGAAVHAVCRQARAHATLGLVFIAIGALAMCLGLMRWPSVHWALAHAYADAPAAVGAVFAGLNVYLGNYIGEFLGEVCLAAFFFLAGRAMQFEPGRARWLAWGGMAFGMLFAIGALRNVTTAVQPLADVNNYLLPLWMIVLGAALLRAPRPA